MKYFSRLLLIGILVLTVTLLCPGGIALASDYEGVIIVGNTGSALTMASIVDNLDVDGLVDNGYLTSTGLDARVKSGATELPFMLADDKISFASALPGSSTTEFDFTTGNSALSDFYITVGDGGYVTTTDHANLELGSYPFDFYLDGYFDTETPTSDKAIFDKDSALALFVDATDKQLDVELNGVEEFTVSDIDSGEHELLLQRRLPIYDGTSSNLIATLNNDPQFVQNWALPFISGARYVVRNPYDSSEVVFAVYIDEGIGLHCLTSYDSGQNWYDDYDDVEIYELDIGTYSGGITSYAVAIDSVGTVHVLFSEVKEDLITEFATVSVWYTKSMYGTGAWTTPVYLDQDIYGSGSWNNEYKANCDLDTDGNGHIYASWVDVDTSDHNIDDYFYCTKGTITGSSTSWGSNIAYDACGGVNEQYVFPAIDVDGNGLCHILFEYVCDTVSGWEYGADYYTFNGTSYSWQNTLDYDTATTGIYCTFHNVDIITNEDGDEIACLYVERDSSGNEYIYLNRIIDGVEQGEEEVFYIEYGVDSMNDAKKVTVAVDNAGTYWVGFGLGGTSTSTTHLYYKEVGGSWTEESSISGTEQYRCGSLLYNSWDVPVQLGFSLCYDRYDSPTVYELYIYSQTNAIGLYVDDVLEGYVFTTDAVTNNANDWVLSFDETTQYLDYYRVIRAGSNRFIYRPDSIIVNDTLPNEYNPGTYDGAITWGTAPSGVTTSFSSLYVTSLDVVDQTDTSIDLTWTKGPGSDYTLIRYSTSTYPTTISSGTQGYWGTSNSAIVSGLDPGQVYYFSAWGYSTEDGYSDGYDTVSDYTLPSDSEFLSIVTTSSTRLDLSWSKGEGGDEVYIRYSTGSYPATRSSGSLAYSGSSSAYGHTGLTTGYTYYYSIWSYDSTSGYYSDGYDTMSGSTSANPSVTTGDATNVSISTADLNAIVTGDGGEYCSVRFQYGETDSYGTNTDWVCCYYISDSVTQRIEGLDVDTTYHFRAQIYNNNTGDSSPVSGSDNTFTTVDDVGNVTNFTAEATSSTEIYLSWSKAAGSLFTVVRYELGSYPSTITDGESAYYGEYVEYTLDGLDPGTTYYFSAWGYAPDDYSDSEVNALATTLPGTGGGGDSGEIPSQPEDTENIEDMPGFGLADWVSGNTGWPVATLMAFGAFVFFYCMALIFGKMTGSTAVVVGILIAGFTTMGYMGFGIIGYGGAIVLAIIGFGLPYVLRRA